MFRTDRFALVVLVEIANSLSGRKYVIDGECVKLIEIKVVINVLKSLEEHHSVFGFVLGSLAWFCQ